MDYSTVMILLYFIKLFEKHVTKKLVKEVLDDAIKVIVDYRMKKTNKKFVDTGKF